MELTTPLPWIHLRPASKISHLDESSMIGTFAISGSAAMSIKKRTMASFDSNIPSSILMSIIWAPFSTCCLATSSAASKLPSMTRRLKAAEPVTLVRSPTLTKSDSGPIVIGSSPAKRHFFSMIAGILGGQFWTASTIALICAGEVPQQPPIMFK